MTNLDCNYYLENNEDPNSRSIQIKIVRLTFLYNVWKYLYDLHNDGQVIVWDILYKEAYGESK
jgi:hypothetical protein